MKPHPSRDGRRAAALGLAALLAFGAGCASRPEIRLDQAPGVDFGAYRSFAVVAPESGAGLSYAGLLATRLHQAAHEQMARRRYTHDGTQPDLLVLLRLVVRERQELRSRATGPAGWRAGIGEIDTIDYRQGTLVIDLVDTRRHEVVWHAAAEGRLDAAMLAQPGPAIEAAVAELFARFPRPAA